MRHLAWCVVLLVACGGGGGGKPVDASAPTDLVKPSDLTNTDPVFQRCVAFCEQGIQCGVQQQTDCNALCNMVVGPDGAASCYTCDFDCANSSSCTAFTNCYQFCPPC
jgi:hypothetical protein